MSIYKQKDLGYERQPTNAQMIFRFSNGEKWSVPLQIIVDSRDGYYSHDQEDTIKFIRSKSLFITDLSDWSTDNMNWSDMSEFAVKISGPEAVNYEEDFHACNAAVEGVL